MNIVLARTFLEIVECGNLKKAADRLCVTQSTVTARVNLLEEALGQQLFVRSRTGAVLTSAGFKFKRYAETLVQVWQQAKHEIALRQDFKGVINFGVDHALWDGPGIEWVTWIRSQAPDVAISVHRAGATDLVHGLSHGLLDISLEFNPITRPGITALRLFEDRLVLVSTEPRKAVKWHPRYIYVDWGESFRAAHSAAFPDEQTPSVTIDHGAWALEFMVANGGSGYFPTRIVARHLREGRLHLIPGTQVFQRAVFATYRDRTTTLDWFERALRGLQEIGRNNAASPSEDGRLVHDF